MILSPKTQISLSTLLQLTTGFLLLFRPNIVLDSNIVNVLGLAMEIPPVGRIDQASLGLIGIILVVMAVQSAIPLARGDMLYFQTLAPIRLLISFVISAYTSGYLQSKRPPVANSLSFTFAFIDLIWQFWLYASFGQEKAVAKGKGKTKEEDHEHHL
ncbi:hypothetical protein YB2330_003854 [Saitoella coloradoensis]